MTLSSLSDEYCVDQNKIEPNHHIPGVRLEVDDFELSVRDGAAAGEEPCVGLITTVLAALTDFTETQIVQEPVIKI